MRTTPRSAGITLELAHTDLDRVVIVASIHDAGGRLARELVGAAPQLRDEREIRIDPDDGALLESR